MRHPPLQAPMLWQAYLCFWIAGLLAAAWLGPFSFCALLLPIVDKRLRYAARLTLAATLFLGGFLFATSQITGQTGGQINGPASGKTSRLCGIVDDVQDMPDNRLRLLLEQVTVDAAALPGITAWTWENPLSHPQPGQTACVSQRVRAVHGFANEGLADFTLQQAARGILYQVWSRAEHGNPQISGQANFSARQRENLREAFLKALMLTEGENQGKAILLALLFGDRRYISQQTVNNFAAGTLAHSLALSGQHLAVAGLLGFICVLATARAHTAIYLKKPRAVWLTLATCPPALLYLWLGNAPASLVRAGCMLFALAFWLTRGKARTTLDALCVALLCISVFSPLSVLDTGLQLSALCVAIIGIAMPALRRMPPLPETTHATQNFAQRCFRNAAQIFAISLVIQLALLPVNLLLFGNAGFWFPLNMVWLPVVGLLALPGAALGLILAALNLTSAAQTVLSAVALPCQWFADFLVWLDNLGILQNPAVLRPHWTALPAFAAVFAALTLKVNRPAMPQAGKRLLVIAIVLLCVGPLLRITSRAGHEISLSALDVGQGQALALRFPGHLRLLLDGGGSNSPRFDPGKAIVAPALIYNDAPHLAAVGNTHPDMDHLGGLVHVLENFRVTTLFDNGQDGSKELGRRWKKLRQELGSRALFENDALIVGNPELGLRLEVLHPPREQQNAQTEWTGNDASLVLRLTRNGMGLALLTGDAGRRVQQRLLSMGQDLRAQVLVAPHHGSDRSFLPEFVEAVRPDIILISCGFRNQYGFPGKILTNWAAEHNIPLLNTGDLGQLTVTWPPDAPLRVATAVTAP